MPSILPNGSLVALWQMVRFEMGLISCPTTHSWYFGGWFSRYRPGILSDVSLVAHLATASWGFDALTFHIASNCRDSVGIPLAPSTELL